MLINKRSLYTLRLFTDFLIISLSFFLAGILAQSLELFLAKSNLFILLIFSNIIWYFSSKLTNLYDDSSVRLYSTTIIILIKNVITQILFAVLFIFFSKELLFTRNFIIFYGVLILFLLSAKHFLFQKLLLRRRKEFARSLAIIGHNEIAHNFRQLLERNPEFGYNFKGYITIDEKEGDEILGCVTDLDRVINKNGITDIVIAVKFSESQFIDQIMNVCDINAVRCYIIPDYLKFASKKFEVSLFSDFPIISVRVSPLEEAQNRFIKRVFDLIITIIAFVTVLWWLLPIIAILIKLTSKGPVFFIQDRVGINEKIFKVYKFRTMTTEASRKGWLGSVNERDRQITKIGKFLRKTNLDEFPQFINVFLGDMSIVGPRPHAIEFNESYRDMVSIIKLRNRAKPGITGWAQIHGYRGDVDDPELQKKRTEKRIEYDIWYIENWSLWLDIEIVFETIIQTITGRNKGT